MSIMTMVRQSVCAARFATTATAKFSGDAARTQTSMKQPRDIYALLSTGERQVSETEMNGTVIAPEIFHRALDQLYAWMSENNEPDGRITIRTKDNDSKPALCADLSVIIYWERTPEAQDEAGSEAGPDEG